MPKIVPTDYKTQKKVFEKFGFIHTRTKGDHFILEKEGMLRPVVIPAYKQVPVFIIKNNIRTAGISNKEYFDVLQGKRK